jgi:DNA processing protein
MTQAINHMSNCLWLSEMNRKGGVSMSDIKNLLRDCGSVHDLKTVKSKELIEKYGKTPERTNQLITFLNNKNLDSQLNQQAEKAVANNIRSVCIIDDVYPERLRTISSSPMVLYYRGHNYERVFCSAFYATIIGTRSPTAYGRIVTEQICSDLARQGVVIISGLARGIDSIAHEAALAADGLTVAVVGNGPDIVYPPENKDLMLKIAEKGIIISEHPPGTVPLKKYFPRAIVS